MDILCRSEGVRNLITPPDRLRKLQKHFCLYGHLRRRPLRKPDTYALCTVFSAAASASGCIWSTETIGGVLSDSKANSSAFVRLGVPVSAQSSSAGFGSLKGACKVSRPL